MDFSSNQIYLLSLEMQNTHQYIKDPKKQSVKSTLYICLTFCFQVYLTHGLPFKVPQETQFEKGDLKKRKINISNSFGYLHVIIVDYITSFFFTEAELVGSVGGFVSFINL